MGRAHGQGCQAEECTRCSPTHHRDRSQPQRDRLRRQEDGLVLGLSSSLLKDSAGHGDELSGVRRELENQIIDLYKALLSDETTNTTDSIAATGRSAVQIGNSYGIRSVFDD
ncbi:hypothetical protein BGZ61DRAFT_539573 [Ilyonectria robusta]|uniref:uncharacterized protein n=1 Tax=Ilyonectria robusta TaxID=1079257 RepID=UPI001E8CF798|nr:uncharacterized protein BGZ61DRAFT_539573 [Ilyonectria robusta]KAH8661751.1 hypothetical protein BGZ61DRAFT_539573 [Ilyonectria robusta]